MIDNIPNGADDTVEKLSKQEIESTLLGLQKKKKELVQKYRKKFEELKIKILGDSISKN